MTDDDVRPGLGHDLANVALALDSLADGLEHGVADRAIAARLIRNAGRRIVAVIDEVNEITTRQES